MPATRNRRKTPTAALVVRQLAAPMPDETLAAPQGYNPVAEALAREYGAMPQMPLEVQQPLDEPSYPALQEDFVDPRPLMYLRVMPELEEAMFAARPQLALSGGPQISQYMPQRIELANASPRIELSRVIREGPYKTTVVETPEKGTVTRALNIDHYPVAVRGMGRRILRDGFGRPVSTGTNDIVEVKRYD